MRMATPIFEGANHRERGVAASKRGVGNSALRATRPTRPTGRPRCGARR